MAMMRLRRLVLTDFRQFAHADIEFHDGLNVITGDNGVGKSTLLEAVLWSLFGEDAVRRDEQSLRRRDMRSDASSSVVLHFDVDGLAHQVTRSVAPHSGSDTTSPAADDGDNAVARLSSDGLPDVTGADAVTRRIAALMSADRDTFMRGCVTGRRELQQLAQMRKAERLMRLASWLGMSAAHARTQASNVIDDTIITLEQELADADRRMRTLASAPDLLAQYETELIIARRTLAESEVRMDLVQDEWAQKKQDVTTKLESYRRRSEELTRQITRLSGAESGGICPTCEQPLGERAAQVTTRLDDEVYSTAQDTKWLLQRQMQLAQKPPDVVEAEMRRAKLRDIVDDLAQRAARCEQAVQELWTLATERQRVHARLVTMRAELPDMQNTGKPLLGAELTALAAIAGQYIARTTDWRYTGILLDDDGRIRAQIGDSLAPVMSGADADLFALALRIATMRQLAVQNVSPPVLILDEPFGALDDTRQKAYLGMLCELTDFQVILCTRFIERAESADQHVHISIDPVTFIAAATGISHG